MIDRVAVAVVHGMGDQPSTFADSFERGVRKQFRKQSGRPDDALVIRPVHWAPILEVPQVELLKRMNAAGRLDWTELRSFMVHFLADVFAYQVTPHDRAVYDAVHAVFARTLRDLAHEAGGDAPLCIVAHSLGTVIASNYVYDLQQLPSRDLRPALVRDAMGDTPLERCETFADFYTLASPLGLFSLRYPEFGRPVVVPGRWLNIYDRDDVIAWPLKTLNDAYAAQVDEDRQLNVGGLIQGPTPLSHTGYWNDGDVHEAVGRGLADLIASR